MATAPLPLRLHSSHPPGCFCQIAKNYKSEAQLAAAAAVQDVRGPQRAEPHLAASGFFVSWEDEESVFHTAS